MNRRRNKVDMEKVFATVISLAIMIALVVGVTSILKSNNKKDDNQKNYIDLNEINEAVSDGNSENVTMNQAANEPGRETEDAKGNGDETETTKVQTADNGENSGTGKTDPKDDSKTSSEITGDADKTADQNPEVPDAGDDIKTAEGNSTGGDQNVPENTDNEGAEGTEGSGTEPEGGDTQVAGNPAELNGEAGETGEPLPGGELAEGTEGPADGNAGEIQGEVPAGENLSGDSTPVSASTASLLGYHFNVDSTLMWPAQGNVILNYNMTNTIYFPTLDVYKCNPAIVISAQEGSVVTAAADGIVMAVYETKETGLTMEIAIGDEYVLTYGQLKDLVVGVGSQVSRGDVLGAVAAPSQYYTVEGTNLYFRVDNAEGPVNPMDFIEAE